MDDSTITPKLESFCLSIYVKIHNNRIGAAIVIHVEIFVNGIGTESNAESSHATIVMIWDKLIHLVFYNHP